ncbi:hypothetical protein WA026_016922 [Henosepilachna vigintioctopunctata]|uniref:Uncharacterized protein n=1 Tax=Henosepilachna vigintioctopunctata TaxID=420089 RepID=A0AAW1U2P2_9CUCU
MKGQIYLCYLVEFKISNEKQLQSYIATMGQNFSRSFSFEENVTKFNRIISSLSLPRPQLSEDDSAIWSSEVLPSELPKPPTLRDNATICGSEVLPTETSKEQSVPIKTISQS